MRWSFSFRLPSAFISIASSLAFGAALTAAGMATAPDIEPATERCKGRV